MKIFKLGIIGGCGESYIFLIPPLRCSGRVTTLHYCIAEGVFNPTIC